ncbi:hypothetical protein GCM10009122_17480 [Fulvivirga kasyanovii]|uniref:Hydrolase n=1 Tax=Fulvivirga kasyanovii TaxID=396812 RepID=A0ABW9RTQ0_9BACT|nr:DUF5916 domain-containing protein [Fulvivirga kasyanovii]MTI26435.1 hypothetical protein [Fulvivirga kasyanovii]
MKFLLLFFIYISIVFSGYAQEAAVKSYTTQRIEGEPPKIDGKADDNAWDQVSWGGGDFTQRTPDDGAAPTVQTQFKILYDAKNLYVLFKNLDPDPAKIVSRMSRRDGFEGDFVEINIDSYYDKRTAFSFTASVSGVKGDEYVSNNGNNWDSNWDPIWYLKTSINDEGWIAEMRIPLSQLRFADKPEHVWGLQVTRRFFRNNERSNWQYIPQDAAGWVHLFGELRGLTGIRPQKQLEIQPYVLAKTERFEKEEGNPYATGSSSDIDFGLDAKIGITSDITLDLTVNPDFGQVEADPSQVNLSAFRLFFPEQRPFFIEGSNILTFPVSNSGNNNLFYSRRIGRNPQQSIDTDDDDLDGDGEADDDDVDEFVKSSTNSRILGAAKITGKNKNGFSWGILESVTAVETAEIDSLGYTREETIEPLTNYFVARAQQDINKGNTLVGGMITATNRKIEDPKLNWLHKSAYTAGLDFTQYWLQRTYFITSKMIVSKVEGSEEAVTSTQKSPERFFQRSDNHHTKLDTTRNELTGTGGTLVFGKRSGKVIYDVGFNWLSPELELNDIGFLGQTDMMTQWLWVQYRKLKPFGAFRSLRVNLNQSSSWDFGGVNTEKDMNMETNFEFKNFWYGGAGFYVRSYAISNADLRGGPALTYPGRFEYWAWLGSDTRKKFSVEVNPWWGFGFEDNQNNRGLWVNFIYRPSNAWNISLNPSVSNNVDKMQYVTTVDNRGEDRYIIAQIDQTTYNMSFRMTYMITPNMSIQYWGQPFAASGSYSEFKKVTEPDAEKYSNRFVVAKSTYDSENDEYLIDENLNGETDYAIENPDFNFAQFRSNMVLRWEYIPGSTLFLVWTQNRSESPDNRSHTFAHLYGGLFDKKPHNIFLLKYTYRFIL